MKSTLSRRSFLIQALQVSGAATVASFIPAELLGAEPLGTPSGKYPVYDNTVFVRNPGFTKVRYNGKPALACRTLKDGVLRWQLDEGGEFVWDHLCSVTAFREARVVTFHRLMDLVTRRFPEQTSVALRQDVCSFIAQARQALVIFQAPMHAQCLQRAKA